MRLGGDFEIDPSVLFQAEASNLPLLPNHFKLWVDTGRSAISLALQEIISRGGVRKALLPAYICPTVVKPFLKIGFQVRFYNSDFAKERPEVETGETLLFAHYHGKRNLPAIQWIKEQRTKFDIFVIEDAVQASLNTNIGDTGDFVITSLRKFLPQPDGAILASNRKMTLSEIDDPSEEFISAKLIGKLLRQFSDADQQFLKILKDAEDLLSDSRPRRMSTVSDYLWKRTNVQNIATTRRDNWAYLNQGLKRTGLYQMMTPFVTELNSGEVPLGFSVRILDGFRDSLREFLRTKSIYSSIHWQLDHLTDSDSKFFEELNLSNSTLTLPIDQRLNITHMEYLISSIKEFYSN